MELKKGDFLVRSWGSTMRYHEFYEVLSVDKSKVYLLEPEVKQTGCHQSGTSWIAGPSSSKQVQAYGKMVRGVLKICKDESFKVEDYCAQLRPTKINEVLHHYGD